ncbi:MAG: hypothetical protein ACPL0C_02650 [Candidatus Bathyarchaeales archaeon]
MEKNLFTLNSKMVGDKRAVSPAISTVILTGVIVVLLLVTTVFANNFLEARLAENEFNAMEQFMQTVGLQIDDVAWTVGRTQTLRYASRYGYVKFESAALNYTIEVKVGSNWKPLAAISTGMIIFNMPISKYSISNNHFKLIFPSENYSFLLEGSSSPVARVFVIEKLTIPGEDYIRITVVPIIRVLKSTVTMGSNTTNYVKIYLPVLKTGQSPRLSQSITITGQNVYRMAEINVNEVRVNVTFPNAALGFTSEFFNFERNPASYVPDNSSVVEVYLAEVRVYLGLHG